MLKRLMPLLLILVSGGLYAQKDSTGVAVAFEDTTGGYGYMYMTVTCYECNPKGLVFYKKFAIISGYYKVKDFYSSIATQSIDHFRKKYEELGYFREKTVQVWKSPRLFSSFNEVKEYRDDLLNKLRSENYMVVGFDDKIIPGAK